MAKYFKTKTMNPCDTEANWSSSNRILLKGEIAFSTDKGNIFKVGNGVDKWSNLPYNAQGNYLPLTGGTLTGSKGSIGLITDDGSVPKVRLTGNNNDEWQLDAFNGTMRLVDHTNAVPCLSVNRTEATMPGKLTLGGLLDLKPGAGEGGEILLSAATSNKSHNGIVLDNYNGTFRIFGIPSADGTTITGVGTPLQINPYNKTITGGYTFVGDVNGTATQCNIPRGFVRRATSQTWGNQNGTFITCWETSNGGDISFRENNGQVNVITDGYFYQNEGFYKCIDTSGGTINGKLVASGGLSVNDRYHDGIYHSNNDIWGLDNGNSPGLYICGGVTTLVGHYYESGLLLCSCSGILYPCRKDSLTPSSLEATLSNGSIGLGTPTYKFGNIYSVSSSLNSDINHKKDISNMRDVKDIDYINIFENIDFCKFKWIKETSGSIQATPAIRNHLGVTAQALEKLLFDNGYDGSDIDYINSEFCYSYYDYQNSLFGGWNKPYEVDKKTYSYSENVYNYKKGLDYEIYNEVIEWDLSKLNFEDYRKDINYLMVEDNSKLASNQPPLYINSIIFIDNDDNEVNVDLNSVSFVSYYEDEETDPEMNNPVSVGFVNDEGQIEINFDKMYGAVFVKLFDETINVNDYKSILFDIDYIGEYRLFLLPNGNHITANYKDRKRTDQILYNYSVNYNSIFVTGMYALQETRKELKSLQEENNELKNQLSEILSRLSKVESEL